MEPEVTGRISSSPACAVAWMQVSAEQVPDGDRWLTRAERATLRRLAFEPRRGDWRMGRWAAKRAVTEWLSARDLPMSHEEVEVVAAGDGHPEVRVPGMTEPPGISLSHGDGAAVCAVLPRDRAVGCDIERVLDRSPAFVSAYMTAREQEWVAERPLLDRPRLVTLLWSAKESALKALREGLRLDVRTVEVLRPRTELDAAVGEWRRLVVQVGEPRPQLFWGWWQERDCSVVVIVVGGGEQEASPPPVQLTAEPRHREVKP